MAKKKQPAPKKKTSVVPLVAAVTGFFIVVVITVTRRGGDQQPPAVSGASARAAEPSPPPPMSREAAAAAISMNAGWPSDLPPLPVIGFPPPRPREVVQAVYQFAVRHPEVLDYVPCFCGCEHSGHKGNTDCFVKSRGSDGRIEWDEHGLT